MITVMLNGGCCNQVWEYGFGLACARRLKTDLVLDISLLQHDSMRRYCLELFKGVNEPTMIGSRSTINERKFSYDQELVDSVKDGDVLRGYFQAEGYIKSVADELREKIQPRQAITNFDSIKTAHLIEQAGKNSTFLTIRRTDYLQKLDFHGVLNMDYYEKALDIIAQKGYKPEVFIFSDEPDWAKKNFKSKYSWQVVGSYDQTTPEYLGREDVDLFLMSKCYNAVMANSSFSWWGSFLGDANKPDRIVIGPKQWFTAVGIDSSTVIPARWQTL